MLLAWPLQSQLGIDTQGNVFLWTNVVGSSYLISIGKIFRLSFLLKWGKHSFLVEGDQQMVVNTVTWAEGTVSIPIELRSHQSRKRAPPWHLKATQSTQLGFHFSVLMYSVQFSHSVVSMDWHSVALCDPRDCSTPGFPVHHQLPELAQT